MNRSTPGLPVYHQLLESTQTHVRWVSDAFVLWCWWRPLSPLDCREVKPVNPKGNQSWIFIGKTDAEAEILILWPPDARNRLIGKDPVAGQDWRQKEKRAAEDEITGWHHWFNRHEFEQALGDSEGWGILACCSPWVAKSWTGLNLWTTDNNMIKTREWISDSQAFK